MKAHQSKQLALTLLGCGLLAQIHPAQALDIANNPLFLTSGGKANILVILDNSNSMDEAPNGSAVGSNSPESKSEIAREVIRDLVDTYTGTLNMGLMSYRQNAPSAYYLHDSPYDTSYDPANYDPDYDLSADGARDSLTKKYRKANPTDAGRYIYYNIALPFYANGNYGNAFCYSNTSDFDNGAETYPGGPWDTYRCYRNKTGTSDVLPQMNGTGAADAGYSSFLYNTSFSPTDSDLAQGILDFGRFNSWQYVGRTWFRNDSPGRGYLDVPIKALDAAQATSLKTRLACNIPPGATGACTTDGIKNAGLTPIQGTLLTARDYFKGTWNVANEGYSAGVYPLPTSCGKDFVVLLTDGLPSTNSAGTAYVDPELALTEATAAAGDLKQEGVETYVVGFALPASVDPETLNDMADAGGTETAYNASDSASLASALSSIFEDIKKKSSSAAALASNSTRLGTDTAIYQAKFNSTNWNGQLLAIKLESEGNIVKTGDELWDASTKLPAPADRKIYTWSGSAGTTFTWDALTAAQKTAIDAANAANAGSPVLDYLRGDRSKEQSQPAGVYRNRDGALGDIINSDPYYVGAQNFGYTALSGAEGTSYASYLDGKKADTYVPMLYVGANDGMLHGFRASTGVELLAYVPNAGMANLASLSQPAYTHKYFVDASPFAGDAYIGGGWKTILLGGMGAGGKAVFALNVTAPATFAADKVLWEFTHADLGYTFGQPVIARLKNGKWAAVFGNGYNSTNGTAKLFIVYLDADLSDGWTADTDYVVISTNTDADNGLSTPALYDSDGDRIIDYVYAGDLRGNLWKFDLTNANANNWAVKNKSGANFIPLFKARNAANQAQPITAPLELGAPPEGESGIMIYFGTGRYYAVGDNATTYLDVQSFYGIWDDFANNNDISYTCNAGGCDRTSALTQQTIKWQGKDPQGRTDPYCKYAEGEEDSCTYNLRVVSTNTVDYDTKRGWYLDLLPPDNTPGGERVVSAPLLRQGRVVFTTLQPSTDPCEGGGSSWLMETDAATGGRYEESVFDINDDGEFNEGDYITVTIDGEEVTIPVSGIQSSVGIIKTPTVISAGEKEYKLASGTSGEITGVTELGGGQGTGRVSWRELFEE